MSLVDTHCHLDDAAYDADRDEVVARARAAGVTRIVVPGVTPAQWEALPALAARYDEVRVAIGIHPQALPDLTPPEIDDGLARLARVAKEARAVAIGECGLDAPVAKAGGPSLDVQGRVLDAHVEVARALGLPLIVHVLGAHGAALARMERHARLPAGGVLHSWSGSAELVPRWIALGFCVSFAGAITRPSARKPVLAARAVPLDRLLVETDGPDQTPTGAPGARNESAFLPRVVEALAAARGEPADVVAERTARNASALFGAP